MSAFANRVQLEIKNRALGEVHELVLDNAEGKEIEGLSAELTSLEVLSLSNVGLESLDGLPNLPSLKSLNLSSNAITDVTHLVSKCPNLEKLNLSKSALTSIDALKPLTELKALTHLDIEDVGVPVEEVKSLLSDKISINAGAHKSVNGGGDVAEKNGESGDAEANEDDEDEDDDEPGLEELEKEDLEDDNEDYNPDAEEEEDDDDEDDVEEDEECDEEAESPSRGTKRKADNGDANESEAKKVHSENGADETVAN